MAGISCNIHWIFTGYCLNFPAVTARLRCVQAAVLLQNLGGSAHHDPRHHVLAAGLGLPDQVGDEGAVATHPDLYQLYSLLQTLPLLRL